MQAGQLNSVSRFPGRWGSGRDWCNYPELDLVEVALDESLTHDLNHPRFSVFTVYKAGVGW